MTRPTGPARHAGGMNIYLINALLVLLVVHQIREHQLDLRALAVPVLAVGAAAVMFLHSVPGGGSDIALDLLCLSAGAALGAVGGLATHLRVGGDGRPLGRAGVLAASMWMALADVLTRLAVVYLRGRRLTQAPRSSRHLPRPAPAPELASGPPSPTVPIRRRRPRRLIHATSRPGPSRPHRGRSDGPASVQAARVRSRAPRAPATGSGRQRTGQACDAPPSSCSPVASMTTTANVSDNSRRYDRPPRRQMTASTAS